jgi:hypothetical protein
MLRRARVGSIWFGLLVLELLLLAWPGTVAAYSSPAVFAAPTHEGGGGGRHYTGSRTDALGCDTCHGGGEALVLEVAGLPEFGWAPGETYTLDLAWSPTIDHAGVLAEFSNDLGAAVGELTLPPKHLLTPPELCTSGLRAARDVTLDGDRRLIAVGSCGAHRLRVQWRAPDDPGVDTVWLHVAGVHGDGAGDTAGDGVRMLAYRLDRIGVEQSGCQTVSTSNNGWHGWQLLGLTLVLGVGVAVRRRRSASAVLLVLAITTTSGCARVQPWERGRLAQPDMQLEMNADLLAGPEHAVEYREGSVGAVGGGGGGCGCN